MPRAITERTDTDFMSAKLNPGVVPESITFWDNPKGVDLDEPISRMGNDKVPYSRNMHLNDAARYVTRAGTSQIGAVAVDSIVGLVVASTRQGVDYHVRVTETTVAVSIGSTWEAYTGPALSIPVGSTVEFAAWGNKLMFVDGASGLYEIDFALKTYALIAGAPVAKHLTVFGGRVVLSDIVNERTRVQWSVKNDNTDWSGLGSGYDDMLSAPGGVVDIQKGIYPITDTEAFIVRTSSIWVMTLTGFSDAPFNFSYRFAQGTDASQSIVRLPNQALIMLGRDDVVFVTASGVQDIGIPVRDQMVTSSYIPRNARAMYDARRMVYRIYIPGATATPTSSTVWEYHIATQSWHPDTYPFQISAIASGGAQRALTIGELAGNIIDLVGPIGELGLLGRGTGTLFGTAAFRVIQESTSATTDVVNDGTTQAVPIALWSGLVQFGGPLARVQMLNLQLEYTATRSIAIVIELSADAGTTWESYGTITLSATTVPQVAVFRKTMERKQFQFRITSTDAVGLQLIAAHATGQRGAPVNL